LVGQTWAVTKCESNKLFVLWMLVMLLMSVMRQHKVIRRYNAWEESFVSDNCTYLCCVALHNLDDTQYKVIFTIYTVLYYYIIIIFHVSFNASQM